MPRDMASGEPEPMPQNMAIRIGAVAMAILAGGCMAMLGPGGSGPGGLGAGAVGPGGLGWTGEASLQVRPDIRPLAGFRAQAVVSPYASADIDHVRIKLFTVANSTETAVKNSADVALEASVPSTSLTQTLTFSKLKGSTTYRVRAYAYKAATETEGNKISVDGSSYVDVAVASDDRPAMAAVPVQLGDKAFAGQATSSLVVTDGVMITPSPETITFPTPTPPG